MFKISKYFSDVHVNPSNAGANFRTMQKKAKLQEYLLKPVMLVLIKESSFEVLSDMYPCARVTGIFQFYSAQNFNDQTFENNLEIKLEFTKYLSDSYQ